MSYEPQGLDRFACPDMTEVRIHQHHRVKSGEEYLSGAYIWCLQYGDYESAMLLKAHLRCVEDDEPGCRLCRPDPFAGIERPLLSIREAESELDEMEYAR